MQIVVSEPSEFIRFTVPLRRGFDWKANACPFTVRVLDGNEGTPNEKRLQTQWERCVLYETPSGETPEIRVAEIIARHPDYPDGRPMTYELLEDVQREQPIKLTSFARAWLGDITVTFDGIHASCGIPREQHARLGTRDVRDGALVLTRFFSVLGMRGYMTCFTGRDVVLFELELHAGQADTPHLFFDALSIACEALGTRQTYGVECAQIDTGVHGGKGSVTLIDKRPDSAFNFLRQQGRRHFRFAVYPMGAEDDRSFASDIVENRGWGMCDEWLTQPAYQAHGLRLPVPTPSLAAQAESFVSGEANKLNAAIAQRTMVGIGTQVGTPNGLTQHFQTPWGSNYGGVTGGGFIYVVDGCEVYWSCESKLLKELQTRLRLTADRMHTSLWMDDGTLPDLDSHTGWRGSGVDGRFETNRSGTWDFHTALARQSADLTLPVSRIPGDFTRMAAWAPIDYQHYVRCFSAANALAWLMNDHLAKDYVHDLALNFQMSMTTDARVGGEHIRVFSAPSKGTKFGRAHGWGTVCLASSYALGGQSIRRRLHPMLLQLAGIFGNAQMPNGLLQAHVNNKVAGSPTVFPGLFDMSVSPPKLLGEFTQNIEDCIMVGGARAMVGSGALDAKAWDPERRKLLDLMRTHAPVGIWGFLWANGQRSGPAQYAITKGWDGVPLRQPGGTQGTDSDMVGAVIGYAIDAQLEQNGAVDALTEQIIERYCGDTTDPLGALLGRTLYKLNLDNTAPLIAALQRV
jgi:hypothetical protein